MPTEREKMLAGELYDPSDPELTRMLRRARDLCRELNATAESEGDRRRALLVELLGEGGDSAAIQPPFHCDYGSNIRLGRNVFFNFNCIVLDVCEVRIGDFTLIGSGVQILTPLHPMDAAARRVSVEKGAPSVYDLYRRSQEEALCPNSTFI